MHIVYARVGSAYIKYVLLYHMYSLAKKNVEYRQVKKVKGLQPITMRYQAKVIITICFGVFLRVRIHSAKKAGSAMNVLYIMGICECLLNPECIKNRNLMSYCICETSKLTLSTVRLAA